MNNLLRIETQVPDGEKLADFLRSRKQARRFHEFFLYGIAFAVMLAGCGLDETTRRSDKPVSRAQASKELSVPFPSSTKDVYYFYHSGGMQEYQLYVRFTVDPGDITNAVDNIGQQFGFSSNPNARKLSSEVPQQFSLTWWTADAITNGFYRAVTNGRPCEIWVNLSAHTIYLSETD
jgi:hypothetical protein